MALALPGAGVVAPLSPVLPRHYADTPSPSINGASPTKSNASIQGRKRKRTSSSVHDHNSDFEHAGGDDGQDDAHPQVPKRACNECRQQKLKCDVIPEPFKHCSRCNRLGLECRIDANFKRVGKRNRHAEMERENANLRAEVTAFRKQLGIADLPDPSRRHFIESASEMKRPDEDPHEGLANSLLDLRNRTDGAAAQDKAQVPKERFIGDEVLTAERIDELFKKYFESYHMFLPVLDINKSPIEYYEQAPLLYWTVIVVASRRFRPDPHLRKRISQRYKKLVWEVIAEVPHNYHVVKALAILCTWPLPSRSTSNDQTFILAGIMMQIALQTGLHRPSHVQEFSRKRIELHEEDIADRLKTWATCNIVLQAVSTGLGQPPKTVYDWTLTSLSEQSDETIGLPQNLYWRLQIERFSNKVSQKFYNNRTDPIGIANEQERAAWGSVLVENYRDLERQVSKHGTAIDSLHLQAAGLHLRLSTFFDASTAPNYINDLLELYFATTKFLTSALDFDTDDGNDDMSLRQAPNYIMQILLASGFTLMKLLNSFFAKYIDTEVARRLFINTIWAIRAVSVALNDLPSRLAEVLAQLWKSSGAGSRSNGAPSSLTNNGDTGSPDRPATDDSLQLKVRCRMSMSLLYDCVWRWREEHQFSSSGDGTTAHLDAAVNNPTDITVPNQAPPAVAPATLPGPANGQAAPTAGSIVPATGSILNQTDPMLTDQQSLAPGNFLGTVGNGLNSQTTTPLQGAGNIGMPMDDFGYFDPLTLMLDGGTFDYTYGDTMNGW